MRIEALSLEMPRVTGHPNRLPFRGVLTTVDESSDRSPAGARGHRVILTKTAAEQALSSLIGMALDHTPQWDGHDAKRKVGIITSADIRGKTLAVSGYLFAKDFPELMAEMQGKSGRLGMSYEVADARVRDVRSEIWVLDEVTFTGAAVLLKEKAAYGATSIEIGTDKTETRKGRYMNQEQSKELINVTQRMASAAEALSESIARLNAQQEDLSGKIERIVAAVEDSDSVAGQMKARILELEAQNSQLREGMKTQVTAEKAHGNANRRKTLPSMVSALLAKSGVESGESIDAATLDAAMSALSIEQRIAVKSQMARAGLIG